MKPQKTVKLSVLHTAPAMSANQSDCSPQIPSKPLADVSLLGNLPSNLDGNLRIGLLIP